MAWDDSYFMNPKMHYTKEFGNNTNVKFIHHNPLCPIMKNALIITTLLSTFGIISTTKNSNSNTSIAAIVLLFLIVGLAYFILKRLEYRKTAYFAIEQSKSKLNNQIIENEKHIKKLEEKIHNLEERLKFLDNIDNNIKEVILGNIEIWKAQKEIHHKMIQICEKRKINLEQKKNELDLLNHLLTEVKNEPNSREKVAELEKMIYDIDSKAQPIISSEIRKLIYAIKTDIRKENIIVLQRRVNELEKKVS